MPAASTPDLSDLLADLDDLVETEISSTPDVIEKNTFSAEDLPKPGTRKWFKLEGVYAVVCDLKGSTALGTGKHDSSTASIYEAATGGAVKVLNRYAADFVAIQGDGAFGLFWGERALERAVCSGITIKTFSQNSLVPQMQRRWRDGPETGFKVGIATGRVLAKLIGTLRSLDEQEPVWAGVPVNYAAKAAQTAQRHELIVTKRVWEAVERIDFLRFSCGCVGGKPAGDPTDELWTDVTIEAIPADRDDRNGKRLSAAWCGKHGSEYAALIMAGERTNPLAAELRAKANREKTAASLRTVLDQKNALGSAQRQGLA